MESDEYPQADNDATQSIGKNISPVRLVPLMTGDVQSARWIVLAILGRRMMVEKVHERTVRNKRHDSFRFIIRGF